VIPSLPDVTVAERTACAYAQGVSVVQMEMTERVVEGEALDVVRLKQDEAEIEASLQRRRSS
jgi:hypothetical protein